MRTVGMHLVNLFLNAAPKPPPTPPKFHTSAQFPFNVAFFIGPELRKTGYGIIINTPVLGCLWLLCLDRHYIHRQIADAHVKV